MFVTEICIRHKLLMVVFLLNAVVETENVSADGQENAHPHANAPETALPDGTAHPEGLAGWFLATRSSFPSSA